ncbi:MAG: hypothetical protein PHD81_01365 [Candidatus Nanoarchaeia archaeon]|nr:hypothetical protein [Candidatus Nanoarchaeia archaeon]MDD5587739.1 hypothetical protein [Candidatus Nanoarchaeia archaeon]
MKTRGLIIFPILLGLVLFISGCNTITGEVIGCGDHYSFVANACCLDQNANKICDKDEFAIREECSIKSEFKCLSYQATPDKITIKLKPALSTTIPIGDGEITAEMLPVAAISKITLPEVGINGCKGVYIDTVENGFRGTEEKTFEIPCVSDKGVIDSDIIIDFLVYKPSHAKGPSAPTYNSITASVKGTFRSLVEEV